MYNKLEKAIQNHIDEARLAEWQNYLKFEAVKVISRKEAERLISSGTEVLPTSWVDVDKKLRTDRDHSGQFR